MSCGNPHATPCTEVLSLVYVYIDNELDEVRRLQVTAHLQECPPCVSQFMVEERIKQRVRSACGCEVTEEIRTRIVARFQSVAYRSEQQ